MNTAIVLYKPEQIAKAQLLVLRSGLRLEIMGMTKRGASCFSILKKKGYKGNKEAILATLNEELK